MRAGKSSSLNAIETISSSKKRFEQGSFATIEINGGIREVQIAGALDGFVTSYDIHSGAKVSGGANFFTPVVKFD